MRDDPYKKTQMAFCLRCFTNQRKHYWLLRHNPSTIKGHLKSVHKYDSVTEEEVVKADSDKASLALKHYKALKQIEK